MTLCISLFECYCRLWRTYSGTGSGLCTSLLLGLFCFCSICSAVSATTEKPDIGLNMKSFWKLYRKPSEPETRSCGGLSRHISHPLWYGIAGLNLHMCAFYAFALGTVPSVLWHGWLGIRKSIWPVKIEWWCVKCGCLSEARCRLFAYGPADATASQTPSSLASFKSRLVLPFWCRLTQVVWRRGR